MKYKIIYWENSQKKEELFDKMEDATSKLSGINMARKEQGAIEISDENDLVILTLQETISN